MMTPKWPNDAILKRINTLLLILALLANGYVVVTPLLPKVSYEIKQHITKPVNINPEEPDTISKIDRSRNHLILPSLQLDEPIFDGVSALTVHKGIWRRPATSTPDKGSNTVLVGHRFTYNGSAVFYNLDKLEVDEDVYMVYDKKIYHYKVRSSQIVTPTTVAIEAPTTGPQLTIYTCTPLVTAKNRLVYVASLVEVL